MENQSNEPVINNVNPSPAPVPGLVLDAAYERRLAEIQAVEEDALVAHNFDVFGVVATVLGVLPKIGPYREALMGLPGTNKALVEGLEDYAEATAEANSRFEVASTPEEDIIALNDAATTLRETFQLDGASLVHRGLIQAGPPDAFSGLKGYKNVASDLINWANLMRESWSSIQGKTGLSLEEIDQAKRLGEHLMRAAGLHEQAPAIVAEVAKIRLQAITLLVKSYEEVRRGLSYLRWREDDVDTIAPSLYAVNRAKRQPAKPVPPAPEPAPAPTPVPPVAAAHRVVAPVGASPHPDALLGAPGAGPLQPE